MGGDFGLGMRMSENREEKGGFSNGKKPRGKTPKKRGDAVEDLSKKKRKRWAAE